MIRLGRRKLVPLLALAGVAIAGLAVFALNGGGATGSLFGAAALINVRVLPDSEYFVIDLDGLQRTPDGKTTEHFSDCGAGATPVGAAVDRLRNNMDIPDIGPSAQAETWRIRLRNEGSNDKEHNVYFICKGTPPEGGVTGATVLPSSEYFIAFKDNFGISGGMRWESSINCNHLSPSAVVGAGAGRLANDLVIRAMSPTSSGQAMHITMENKKRTTQTWDYYAICKRS